jgi:hypothetical protein
MYRYFTQANPMDRPSGIQMYHQRRRCRSSEGLSEKNSCHLGVHLMTVQGAEQVHLAPTQSDCYRKPGGSPFWKKHVSGTA